MKPKSCLFETMGIIYKPLATLAKKKKERKRQRKLSLLKPGVKGENTDITEIKGL